MDKKWCVYIHTSPSGKRYVGITSQNPEKRWGKDGKNYLDKNKEGKYRQPAIANAIVKYPNWNEWEHVIFDEGLTHDEACNAEKFLIAKLDTYKNGYNETEGGEGAVGIILTEEHKRKISESRKGKFLGEANSFYGKKHTEKSKMLMREHHVGKSGEENHFYGKHHTEEFKNMMREMKGTPVCQFDMDLNFIKEYPSIAYAEKCTGIWESMINGCCNKQVGYKTAGGFVWVFKSDFDNLDKQAYKEWLNHEKLPKPICQFTLEMKFINEYPSIGEAERSTGIASSNISLVASGEKLQTGGYIWVLKDDYEKMKRGEIPFREPYKKPCCRAVLQYTLDMEFVQEFESRVEAGKSIGVTPQAIGYACNSETHKSHGYLWFFKEVD